MMKMVVQGYDGSIWTSSFSTTGVFNDDWTTINGSSPSAPALVRNASSGKIALIVRGQDEAIWKNEY
jgi:hypothetical protein